MGIYPQPGYSKDPKPALKSARCGLLFLPEKKCLSEASCFFQKKKPPTSGQPL